MFHPVPSAYAAQTYICGAGLTRLRNRDGGSSHSAMNPNLESEQRLRFGTRHGAIGPKSTPPSEFADLNADASKSAGVQVKTNQNGRRMWLLNRKAEDFHSKNLYYVLVCLKAPDSRPDFFVVPGKDVAWYITRSHSRWLARPGRGGRARARCAARAGRPNHEGHHA